MHSLSGFVVLPFNDYLAQVRYAATVESIPLEAGLTVIAPPRGRKAVEERKSAGIERETGESSVSDTSLQRAEQRSLRLERYTVMGEETRAEDVVETMLNPRVTLAVADALATEKALKDRGIVVSDPVQVYDDFHVGSFLDSEGNKLWFCSPIRREDA